MLVNFAAYQDTVDLQKKACSGGEYEDLGLHCAHAMAAINTTSVGCHCFIDNFFIQNYKKIYGVPIHPTLDRSQWLKPTIYHETYLPDRRGRLEGLKQSALRVFIVWIFREKDVQTVVRKDITRESVETKVYISHSNPSL